MNAPKRILAPDFKKLPHHELVGRGLSRSIFRFYKPGDSIGHPSGSFYERPYIGGKQTWRKLPGATLRLATMKLVEREQQHEAADAGVAANPYARAATKLTVGEILEAWIKDGCKKRNGQSSTGKQLSEHTRRAQNLKRHIGKRPWNTVTQDVWIEYGNARLKEIEASFKTGTRSGTRAVDLERHTWDASMLWARRRQARTGVTENPLGSDRPRFHDVATGRKTREVMPASGDELHAIARYLFQDRDREVLAWLHLFQAKIGHRIGTMVLLRWSPAAGEPGYIQRNEKGVPKVIHLVQRRSHKGTASFRRVDHDLRILIEAYEGWRSKNKVSSEWMFPMPTDPSRHIDENRLTVVLDEICPAIGIPKRTAHGNRAFSINSLRSIRDPDGFQKYPDSEIALMHGQKSAREIVDVYGEALLETLAWMPSKKELLAWKPLDLPVLTAPPDSIAPVQLSLDLPPAHQLALPL